MIHIFFLYFIKLWVIISKYFLYEKYFYDACCALIITMMSYIFNNKNLFYFRKKNNYHIKKRILKKIKIFARSITSIN